MKRFLLLTAIIILSACSSQAERTILTGWHETAFVGGATIALPATGTVRQLNDCMLVQSQPWDRDKTHAMDDEYFVLHFCPMTEYDNGEDYLRQMCMPIGEDSRGYLIDFTLDNDSARIWGIHTACWNNTIYVVQIGKTVYRAYLGGDETSSGQEMAAEAVKTIRLVQ